MKIKHLIFAATLLFAFASCGGKEETTSSDKVLAAPSEILISRAGDGANVSWKDNSDGEIGFSIWLRPVENLSQQDKIGEVAANVCQYSIAQGLEDGASYYIGVKAESSDASLSSKIVYETYTHEPEKPVTPEGPKPEISAVETSSCSAFVTYSLESFQKQSGVLYGLCWSESGNPSIKGPHQSGPDVTNFKASISQAITVASLTPGVEYKVCAYFGNSYGVVYSEPWSVSLPEGPGAITMNWKRVNSNELVSDVEVYETTDNLNGRVFHAWYAIADLSKGKVGLKVLVPSAAATVDDQAKAAGNCYVLVNGGYFYNGRHTGVAVLNSELTGSIGQVRGSLVSTSDPEWNVMYNVTRGIFGIDANGTPKVCWAGTSATDNKTRFYDSPLPSVKGEARYAALSDTNPASMIDWKPVYALSAGPLLLKDGNIPLDFTTTSKGDDYYRNNFEIIPYDIFGPNVIPDRTAVGYTADGKVVLFICDGRYSGSQGATLVEEAQILKGIGCVGAINLDGGGSTGMMVGSTHINDITTGGNRAVVSTIGFFKK